MFALTHADFGSSISLAPHSCSCIDLEAFVFYYRSIEIYVVPIRNMKAART